MTLSSRSPSRKARSQVIKDLKRRLLLTGQTFTVFVSSAEGEVRMPSGKAAKPDITDNKDGTVTVKYAPTEAGLHEMDIKYDGIHIPGTTTEPSGPPHVTAQTQSELIGPESQTSLYSAVHRKSFTVLCGLHEQWECQCVRSRADPWDSQQAGCVHRRYQGCWRRLTPTFFIQPSSSPLRNPVNMITCSFRWSVSGHRRAVKG